MKTNYNPRHHELTKVPRGLCAFCGVRNDDVGRGAICVRCDSMLNNRIAEDRRSKGTKPITDASRVAIEKERNNGCSINQPPNLR